LIFHVGLVLGHCYRCFCVTEHYQEGN
jgi:hypothetical protein